MLGTRKLTTSMRGRHALAVTAVGACAVLAGCGSSSDSNGSAASGGSSTTVSVGISAPNINLLPLWIAEEKGYYRKAGLTIKTVLLSPTTTNTALTSGSVNFLDGSPNNFVSALAQHVSQLTVSATSEGLPLGLVVSKKFADEHHITSSTPTRTIAHAMIGSAGGAASPTTKGQAALFLKENGVSINQVKVALLSTPSVYLTAMKTGQIDWFETSEPLPLQAQAQGLGTVVATPSNTKAWTTANTGIGAIMITTGKFADANSSTVSAFVKATEQATAYIRRHESASDVIDIAAKNLTGVPRSVIKQSIASIDWPPSGRMTAAQWTTTVKFIASLGTLPSGAQVTSADWTNKYLP